MLQRLRDIRQFVVRHWRDIHRGAEFLAHVSTFAAMIFGAWALFRSPLLADLSAARSQRDASQRQADLARIAAAHAQLSERFSRQQESIAAEQLAATSAKLVQAQRDVDRVHLELISAQSRGREISRDLSDRWTSAIVRERLTLLGTLRFGNRGINRHEVIYDSADRDFWLPGPRGELEPAWYAVRPDLVRKEYDPNALCLFPNGHALVLASTIV